MLPYWQTTNTELRSSHNTNNCSTENAKRSIEQYWRSYNRYLTLSTNNTSTLTKTVWPCGYIGEKKRARSIYAGLRWGSLFGQCTGDGDVQSPLRFSTRVTRSGPGGLLLIAATKHCWLLDQRYDHFFGILLDVGCCSNNSKTISFTNWNHIVFLYNQRQVFAAMPWMALKFFRIALDSPIKTTETRWIGYVQGWPLVSFQ